jgi:hypothetical protein
MKNTKFNVIAIILIIIFCVAISPITMQNDTYYTIAIGKHIEEYGIDMQDPFSWHEDLPYTYPHWLYDLSIYKIYSTFETIGLGFEAIYASTVLLAIILGITIYKVNSKIAKNNVISFLITIGALYALKDFIAARAQLVTFILFILTIYFIEKFLETKKKRYAVGLIIIPILIANLHSAVWPFYFVLYLPYIAEQIVAIILKKNTKQEDVYKIYIQKNNNVKWLILIMAICLFTGLCTPLGNVPYTYLINTMRGNTTQNISEHLPMVIMNNAPALCALVMVLAILIFTKTKIRLRDLFMITGLGLLMLYSRRQETMFILIGSVVLNKLIVQLIEKENKKEILENEAKKLIPLTILTLMIVAISLIEVKSKIGDEYVSKELYPVEMSEFILNYCEENNIDLADMRLYNEYNYGSYLLFKGIPVFIDSRADLYAPEFNTETGNAEDGRDIFSDFMNVSNLNIFYGDIFEKYNITHIILYKNSKMNLVISNTNDGTYKLLKEDNSFVFYEIVK